MFAKTAGIASLVLLASLYYNSAFITWIEPRLPLQGTPAAPGSPWPMPEQWTNSSEILTLDPNDFQIKTNLVNCDVIDQNIETYRHYIFSDASKGKANDSFSSLKGMELTILGQCEEYITMESNEKYFINISKDNPLAQIKANTIWGALRALETFSQLVWQSSDGSYFVNLTSISDAPRFAHRGVLLDTARHYLPKTIILRNLDAMQFNKFNVFHWHLVDDQSFPYESKTFANLSALGAYSPRHVYTQSDVAEIIEYARLRGIRVLPEFDSPGHTRAIGNAFKHLLTPCYGDGEHPYTPNYTSYSEMEVLDPTNEGVYDFMKSMISEIKGVFKDAYIHLGMDEVNYGCWKSNPDITKFMSAKNLTEYSDLEDYYAKRITDMVDEMNYKYLIWQDPIDNDVNIESRTRPAAIHVQDDCQRDDNVWSHSDPDKSYCSSNFQPTRSSKKLTKNALIHVWKDVSLDPSMKPWREYIEPIAKKGYNMLLSSCWYLNYISYGPDWKNYYQCDPQNFNGTDAERDLVKGGEAALWGEYADGTNILARLWPRASAVAERLWSPAHVNDTDSANFRLDQQRCRMLRRGIPAEPILNGFCGDYEFGMPAAQVE